MTKGRDADAMMRASDQRRQREVVMRLLPILGVFLCCIPLIWRADGAWETSRVVAYMFSVWAGMIIAAAWLARSVRRASRGQDDL